jgi:hypothetical protein
MSSAWPWWRPSYQVQRMLNKQILFLTLMLPDMQPRKKKDIRTCISFVESPLTITDEKRYFPRKSSKKTSECPLGSHLSCPTLKNFPLQIFLYRSILSYSPYGILSYSRQTVREKNLTRDESRPVLKFGTWESKYLQRHLKRYFGLNASFSSNLARR